MKRRPRSRAALLSIFIIGCIFFAGIVYAWNTTIDLFNPASNNTQIISLEIKPGETTAQIADDLQNKGLIRNAVAFRVWARIKGLDHQLQAGLYKQLSPSMSITSIIDRLLNGQPDAIPYTIIEGYRIEQIAALLGDGRLVKFKKDDFLNYAEHPDQFPDKAKYPLLQDIPQGYGMEGLLFATTYEIPVQSTAQDVINIMLQETDTVITQNNLDQIAKQHQYKNVYDLINLASIVERETGNEATDYRPQIASVYWNRLFVALTYETVGFMNADPTSQYGRDTANPPTKYWLPIDNVHIDGPYNTYDNTKGLPPTPICSPGLASLQAAAAPAKTDYLYFYASTDGKDYFAATNAEINQLQAQHPVR
jgi:UPF0755 protein